MLKLNRAASWMLVLAAGVAFQNPAWAQHDSPIIIHGGSPLSIRYDGGWKQINPLTLVTRFHDSTVTSVKVTVNGGAQRSIPFDHQQCEIRLKFGTIDLAVQSDPKGQNLRATILSGGRFGKELERRSGRHYQSRKDGRIESLTILKGGVPQLLPGPVSGPVDIIIEHARATPNPDR